MQGTRWQIAGDIGMMVAGPVRSPFLCSRGKGVNQRGCKRQDQVKDSMARGLGGKHDSGLSQKPQLLPPWGGEPPAPMQPFPLESLVLLLVRAGSSLLLGRSAQPGETWGIVCIYG